MSTDSSRSDADESKDLQESETPEPSIQDSLLNDSRITPTGNGSADDDTNCTVPTSGQKWWAAVLLAFVAVLILSPPAYEITSTVTTALGGMALTNGPGANIAGLVIHTIILIIIFRLILW